MKFKSLVPVVIAALLMAACSTTGGTKQTVGTIGGAVAGGALGSRFGGGTGKLVATGVGTLLGAFVGSEIGASLDKADQTHLQRATQQAYAAPIGEKIAWNNPQSGNYGTITPLKDGYTSSGSYCREYQQTVTVNGRVEQAFGTACQQPDGSWRLVQQ
ncbi:MAG TPA: RT0821/Lpp0805 family surface protein [Azospirillaceae bacterium]|nr:RT0821/Lpp0805 family surface protein [Azospirillaceae bacterium]